MSKSIDQSLESFLNRTLKGLKTATRTKDDISPEVADDLAAALVRASREADYEPADFINYLSYAYGIRIRASKESLAAEMATELESMAEQRDELAEKLDEVTAQRDELVKKLRMREAWPPLDNMADVLKAEALSALMVYDLGLLQDIETLMQ